MKVLFIGLGSIGLRHANILLADGRHELYALSSKKSKTKNLLGITELKDWEAVKRIGPEVAFITNPTALHVKTALKCAEIGMHLFIEKPLSSDLAGVSSLSKILKQKKLASYVAYCLRFHPVIKKIRELIDGLKIYHVRVVCSSYLPAWREGHDSKKSYSAYSKMGGGVLLDLSHEFDYVNYILGDIKKISGKFGRASDLTVDSEDWADVLVEVENGLNVNIHLDFLSKYNERTMLISHNKGYILGDLISGSVISMKNGMEKKYNLKSDRNDYLKEQIDYFFKNLKNPDIMNSISKAKTLLSKILEFKNGKK